MNKEELEKSLDFVNEERERLQQEIDKLYKALEEQRHFYLEEIEKLNKYVYRLQQVITDDLISKIGDIDDE